MSDQVNLGDQVVKLVAPQDIALLSDVYLANEDNTLRAFAAALGACWLNGGSPNRPRTTYAQCKYNPQRYGGEVLKELVARGVSVDQIAQAGQQAFMVVTRAFIDIHETFEAAKEVDTTNPT